MASLSFDNDNSHFARFTWQGIDFQGPLSVCFITHRTDPGDEFDHWMLSLYDNDTTETLFEFEHSGGPSGGGELSSFVFGFGGGNSGIHESNVGSDLGSFAKTWEIWFTWDGKVDGSGVPGGYWHWRNLTDAPETWHHHVGLESGAFAVALLNTVEDGELYVGGHPSGSGGPYSGQIGFIGGWATDLYDNGEGYLGTDPDHSSVSELQAIAPEFMRWGAQLDSLTPGEIIDLAGSGVVCEEITATGTGTDITEFTFDGAAPALLVPLGLIIEHERVQSETMDSGDVVHLELATETESVRALNLRKVVHLGLILEDDGCNPVMPTEPAGEPIVVDLGLIHERETVQSETMAGVIPLGLITEDESCQPLDAHRVVTTVSLGLITEDEMCNGLHRVKVVHVATPAGSLPPPLPEGYATPRELELAQPLTLRKIINLGLITEDESCNALTVESASTTVPLGNATEDETCQPIHRRKTVHLGLITSSETCQPVTPVIALGVLLPLAVETEAVQPLHRQKVVHLGRITVAELAQPLTERKTRHLGLAAESETAQALTRIVPLLVSLGLIHEHESCFSINPPPPKNLPPIDLELFVTLIPGSLTATVDPCTLTAGVHAPAYTAQLDPSALTAAMESGGLTVTVDPSAVTVQVDPHAATVVLDGAQ